jgi:hypothetical protein
MLPEDLQKAVDHGVSGTDILHGQMKVWLLEAEEELDAALKREEESGEAMDSMERTYAEGQLDCLLAVNELIIDLTYAITERNAK